jgi:hypothetical protein
VATPSAASSSSPLSVVSGLLRRRLFNFGTNTRFVSFFFLFSTFFPVLDHRKKNSPFSLSLFSKKNAPTQHITSPPPPPSPPPPGPSPTLVPPPSTSPPSPTTTPVRASIS